MKVFLNEFIHEEALAKLKSFAEVTDNLDEIAEVDAIILRAFPVPRELMEKAHNLKVIAKHGVGYNTIDIEAAKELNKRVIYTPTANTNSVAELILALMMDISRNITTADRQVRENQIERIAPIHLTGLEITGKTLGLIGMGNIARRVAEMAKGGFGVNVIGYDPYTSGDEAKSFGITKLDTVAEVLKRSDIVNISVPLTEETKNLIAGDVFNYFKKNAILINAARGGIVNEEDLYNHLVNGTLRAAACDAFEIEPPTTANKLVGLDNFVATPHIGANTEEALYRMGMETVDGIYKELNGGQANYRVV
ncbi:hydroxyacid dehydrogenase [Anaerotignum sp. MB30-C6]|uniref:hydroxyacid dehydrogenase n=1 Tax=Anaerotignum sp. MB30-C6 TaxID=3070814 RepID=UPI0027DAC566|nr:hydroxyacid dehydrogenase [Anaerotignum sp. MB30-C6]WMI80391.1 hydroxyacid dehydrogenase [Anaerotignum sp. MB30-C6]